MARQEQTAQEHSTAITPLLLRGLVFTAAAVLINILVWAIALPVLGIDVRIPEAPRADELEELGVWSVIGVTVVAGLATVAVAALFQRFTPRPRLVFLIVTGLGLALSLLPITELDIELTGQLVLAVMHVVVYAAVVPRLTGQLAERHDDDVSPASP